MFPLITALLVCSSAAPAGYSLDETWDGHWRRVLDRSGRLDPDGAVMQWMGPRQYGEYTLDLEQARTPLAAERAWTEANTGGRVWVESLDEFELANQLQLKTRADIGDVGFMHIRYDRLQTREVDSNLVRLGVAAAHPDGGAYVGLELFPRWEKEDSDLGLTIGYRRPGFLDVSVRIYALDPFINASVFVAETRRELAKRPWQQEPALAIDGRARVNVGRDGRAELYLGGLVSGRTNFRYRDDESLTHDRMERGLLAGGLLEWRLAEWPLWVGSSAVYTRTTVEWDHPNDDAQSRQVDEQSMDTTMYALWQPWSFARFEAYGRLIHRPERTSFVVPVVDGVLRDRALDDLEMRHVVRAIVMPVSFVGVDLAVMRHARLLTGDVRHRLNETNYRVVTRLSIQLLDPIWMSFGVSWDIDGNNAETPYDGGGATVVMQY